jgi:alkanesulfonate monooxygenase SsuD/methylene tetrahydromethanopterin reductase-like flavin-dependent oxidoreductase (luciferase family)
MEIGYKLCSEENSATALVEQAEMAENSGFSFAMISDHYHPSIKKTGSQSVCLGDDRGCFSRDAPVAHRDRSDLPNSANTSRNYRPGRGHGSDNAAWTVCVRVGYRRELE